MAAKKPLLFIDTNIFLDIYRSGNESSLALLNDVLKVSEFLITTDQVEMEFLNNRQKVIHDTLAAFKLPQFGNMPAFVRHTRAHKKIQKGTSDVKKTFKSLEEQSLKVLSNPSSYDPAFRTIRKIFETSKHNLKNSDASEHARIFDAASRRCHRGFPPRKADGISIGDAINWEWILTVAAKLGSDVVIISRDNDYGISIGDTTCLNDALTHEFREKVSPRKRIQLFRKLTEGLKRLNLPITPTQEKEEEQLVNRQLLVEFEPYSLETLKKLYADDIMRPYVEQLSSGTHFNNLVGINFPHLAELQRTPPWGITSLPAPKNDSAQDTPKKSEPPKDKP